jgi:hypothetical protein
MHCGAVSTAAEQEGVEECQCSHLAVAPQSSCSCGSVMYDSLPKAILACSKQHSSSLACSRHATEEAGRLCQVAGQVQDMDCGCSMLPSLLGLFSGVVPRHGVQGVVVHTRSRAVRQCYVYACSTHLECCVCHCLPLTTGLLSCASCSPAWAPHLSKWDKPCQPGLICFLR